MAFEIGTATDQKDLLNKLHTFLTGLASNPWTANRFTAGDELFLQGQGAGGTDEIYCSIKIDESIPSDYFNWRISGAIGYNAANDQANQPNAAPLSYVAFWDQSIPYWFVANGRRFIVMAKISTTYHGLYMGFILPFATPNEYPYPLYIGGESTLAAKRWSSTDEGIRCFWDPGNLAAHIHRNDGQWLAYENFGGTTIEALRVSRNIMPFVSQTALNYRTIGVGRPPDASYPLTPLTMVERIPTTAVVGDLEGVYAVTGFGNAAENTVTINSVVHTVFQNIFRTEMWHYAAVALT